MILKDGINIANGKCSILNFYKKYLSINYTHENKNIYN